MKFASLALLAALSAVGAARAQQTPAPLLSSTSEERSAATNSQLTTSISEVLKIVGSLKPGMTRADVLKHFTEEGGLSYRTQHTYVYRGCPYIKITVKFDSVPGTENGGVEYMEDKIVEVSQPFLQWSIAD